MSIEQEHEKVSVVDVDLLEHFMLPDTTKLELTLTAIDMVPE